MMYDKKYPFIKNYPFFTNTTMFGRNDTWRYNPEELQAALDYLRRQEIQEDKEPEHQ